MNEVTLSRPVEHEGKIYDKITIDEPTLGAIEAMEKADQEGKGDVGKMLALLACDTGWPEAALRKIRSGDLKRISDAIAPFVQTITDTGGA